MSLNPSTVVPLAGVRKLIARKMTQSLSTAAQLTFHTRIDATHLCETRARWKDADVPVGYEDLVLVALRAALEAFPAFNANYKDDALHLFDEMLISVALAVNGGLVAPALPDIRSMSFVDIVDARRAMMERARSGKLSREELSFGTFSISNLGTTRVDHFTPILNGNQVGIVGLGRLAEEVVLLDGAVSGRMKMGMSLTTDHRFIDGAPSGEFLTLLSENLEAGLPQP